MTDNRLIDKLDNDNIPVFNVSEITNEIRNLLENKYPYVKIKGEISGVTQAKSGHVYLKLKDEKNNIKGVIWAGILQDLLIQPNRLLGFADHWSMFFVIITRDMGYNTKMFKRSWSTPAEGPKPTRWPGSSSG